MCLKAMDLPRETTRYTVLPPSPAKEVANHGSLTEKLPIQPTHKMTMQTLGLYTELQDVKLQENGKPEQNVNFRGTCVWEQ